MSQPIVSLRAVVQDLPSFRMLIMLFGGLLLAVLVRDAGPIVADATFAAAAATLSLRLPLSGALAVGGVAWMVTNGFVVHEYGILAWTGYGDALRLAVFLTAAVCAAEATGHLR